ncbi:unnamed protein product [Clonostachys solani]|uniref:laccase n=1 Tax=Clonostachys solani TaxID=160281 RepID=A0A9P0EM19_9HYPO|nr:unnamed protein product [Clonostachys solani]
MVVLNILSLSLLGGFSGVLASSLPAISFIDSELLSARASCSGNTATSRSQWCDYSIDTDYATEPVDTGVTREYWLELTDETASPDGVSRSVMLVNKTLPGPTIFADWGDDVIIHVTNSLSSSLNGTSIHWHGIRQNYTNQNDGVVSITQCPLAVGKTTTYSWKATQYGTSWYHSHFGLQAWQGVFGGIIINGPATANYDEDLGVVFLNDWDHQTVDELYTSAQTTGPPTLDTGLINGTNVFGDDDSSSQTGTRLSVPFSSGTSYRMRLVNAAVDTHWRFSIDNHTMTVIASDLVPIEPYTTTVLSMGMGQRYDIIVNADQADVAENFWMRAIPQGACSENDSTDNIKAIVYYGDAVGTPSTTGYSFTDGCDDETDNITPYISKTVASADWSDLESASLSRTSGLIKWNLNSTSMLVEWANPTLGMIMNSDTEYETQEAVIELPEADEWVYLVIQNTGGIPHPIHLHGHDFFILAQGSETYSSSVTLNTDNPPRRDTAMLPASGYLVMAWESDNPGAWLMHCHIGWHTSEGFGLQFVERDAEIPGLVDNSTLVQVCDDWEAFQEENLIEQEDSGI